MELVGTDTVTLSYCDVVTNVCDTAYLIMTFENCDDDGGIMGDGAEGIGSISTDIIAEYIPTADDISIESTEPNSDLSTISELGEALENAQSDDKSENGILEFVSFSMYPVPATDILTINYVLEREQNIIIEILNLEGKTLYTEKTRRIKFQSPTSKNVGLFYVQ